MKHLNPRQGITTLVEEPIGYGALEITGVKHLNPRQGITTLALAAQHPAAH